MSESLLHHQLKMLYAHEPDATEQVVGGFRIDAVDDRGRLVEIQTGSFAAIAPKLRRLLKKHTVVLVHPVCARRWIVLQNEEGVAGKRRASPLRGRWEELFSELVALPDLMTHPRLRIEVLLTEEEEWRQVRPARRRQKPYLVLERRLSSVQDQVFLESVEDWLRVLPEDLERWFTSRGLAQRLEVSEALARCITYCLREAGLLRACGKVGNRVIHARAGDSLDPDPEQRQQVDLRELKRGDWVAWKKTLRAVYKEQAETRLRLEGQLEQLADLLRAGKPERVGELLEEERRRTEPVSRVRAARKRG
ncbi:MAG: hypothetical protein H6678_01685 [Candidatus Delongbacteria bacterium]|nr:hypothetical protein [Candidatus Delongbacteria bacterium]